jgi:SAM-dependent methyltransferase
MTDELQRGQIPRIGSHEEFVERFDEYLGAVCPPSGALRSDTGQTRLAASLLKQLDNRSAERVLDCAAGTGFPTLDLQLAAPERFVVHCCDGDELMVARMARRASGLDLDFAAMVPPRRQGSGAGSMVLNWANLGELEGEYDYLLCRGNALAYADTWSGELDVASAETIRRYIGQMCDLLVPGGYLHVDAPKTIELGATTRRDVGHKPRSVAEQVTLEVDENGEPHRRRWDVTFNHKGQRPVSFTRYSSLLTIADLQRLLEELGLEETDPVELPDERPNFGVIIARKPKD